MLTAAQTAELRALMESQILEIEELLAKLQDRVQPVAPDAAIGRLSRTDSMVNAGTVEMAMKEARGRLTRLRNRLAKLGAPGFDTCSVCGAELSHERLVAAPDRGVCVQCLRGKG